MAHDLGMVFTVLNDLKIKSRMIFHDIRKLCEIQISVRINKVLLEYSVAHLCIWFHLATAELGGCIRDHLSHKT